MQATNQSWCLSDVDSTIAKVSQKLDALSWGYLYSVNYNTDIYRDQTYVRTLLSDVDRYQAGSLLCKQYLYGILRFEEFCNLMDEYGLKHYLTDVCKALSSTFNCYS